MKLCARYITLTVLAFGLLLFSGCGDDPVTPPPPPPPPPTPAAAIEVSGNGDIVLHPSADSRFAIAVEFPIQIRETGGGTAVWNFFRVSWFRNGIEIERAEQGADAIAAAGFRNVGARATVSADVIIRQNSSNWDDLRILLGFADNKDGRNFEHELDLGDFDGVVIDLTPAMIPDGSTFTIVSR
jgi:hypothetical protein